MQNLTVQGGDDKIILQKGNKNKSTEFHIK